MKKFLIACIIALLGITSCEDAINIDPGVIKKPVYPAPEAYTVDSVDWHFVEIYPVGQFTGQFYWNNSAEITKAVVRVDTSDSQPLFWMELEVRNDLPESYFRRQDRVVSFRMGADTVAVPDDRRPYSLNGPINSARWCAATIADLTDSTGPGKSVYTGEDVDAFIYVEHNADTCVFGGVVSISFMNVPQVETVSFNVIFDAYYKENK